jgi:hypothetical protein
MASKTLIFLDDFDWNVYRLDRLFEAEGIPEAGRLSLSISRNADILFELSYQTAAGRKGIYRIRDDDGRHGAEERIEIIQSAR